MRCSLRQGLLAILGSVVLLTATAQGGEPSPRADMDAPDPYLEPPPPGRVSWFKACFQRHNCCCASHHNDLGCTSGTADCKFIFGSCRTFYSEPCPQGPSPYRYVPPQSTKPPSKLFGHLLGRCASCEQAAP